MTFFENRTETLREETSGVKVIRRHDWHVKTENAARSSQKTKGNYEKPFGTRCDARGI